MNIPLEFLMGASDTVLEGVEMARLNRVANLRKEIALMEKECQLESTAADVVRWLRDNRKEMLRTVGSHLEAMRDSDAA